MDKVMYNAFEEIREFIVYNDIEISCKDDLIELFVKMREKGYFGEVKKDHRMRELRENLSVFSKIYEKDATILDPGLIIRGPNKVLERIEKYKKRKC